MERNCGRVDWTTLFDHGISEKDDNCSNTTSAHKYFHSDIVQQVKFTSFNYGIKLIKINLYRRLVGSWNGKL